MTVLIRFEQSEVDPESAADLDALATLLVENDIGVERIETAPVLGKKDLGLTAALSIAALAISASGSVLDAIRFWRESRSRYSIQISQRDRTVSIDGLSDGEVESLLAGHGDEDVVVEVVRRLS